MGVRRAMEIALAEANKSEGPLSTFGPLIHNRQVMELLHSKGVMVIQDLQDIQPGRIVIRAHGIPPQTRQTLKKRGLKLIDATCPRVARVQALIRYHTNKGFTGVIVGDRDHPEVVGLMGYGKTPVHVINSIEEVPGLPNTDRLFVVAQTTQDSQEYVEIVKAIRGRFPEVLVFETICDATLHRQEEVRSFAGQVDAVVVVGGYHSGNTQRLFHVSRKASLPTFHVETEKDLDKAKFKDMEEIGVTAGASTPNWMIQNVVKFIEGIRSRREHFLSRGIRKFGKFLVLTNLFAASGAFCFTYAASILSAREPLLVYPLLTSLYIYAMHVLNRFLDKGASAYNDPERARFYGRYGYFLIGLGIVAIFAALALSYSVGPLTFYAVCGLSLLGTVYSIPLIPSRFRKQYRFSKIKDIPGSKTLSQALAMIAVVAFLPLLAADYISWSATVVTAVVVFLMAYVRSGLFDIFQLQGDLIVGAETLPVTLGEKRTLHLLKLLLLSCGLILFAASILKLIGVFSYLFLVTVLTLSICLFAYERRWFHPGIGLEALVESNFFLAGLLGFLYQAIK
jgi:4-hydroxy-3-methylbut-2-enyl diphosphate reductase